MKIKIFPIFILGIGILNSAGCVALEETSGRPERIIPEPVEMAAASVKEGEKEFARDNLPIDNFNSGEKINMLGGEFGAWDKDPEDASQTCEIEHDPEVKIGKEGYSLKLKYDVDSPYEAYNGLWMKLQGKDFSGFSKLYLSVKGDWKEGHTEQFKLELKNEQGEVGTTLVSGITSDWQEKVIPFYSLNGITDFTKMSELVIVFDDQTSVPKTGVIYLDNIYISK